MVISCTLLFAAFWISACRSLVAGLFLASKINSCGCHGMMANLSQSERKELTGVSLSGQQHICTFEPLRPQVKDKHAPVELESWPLSRLKVACWKGHRLNLFHLLFSPYLFFLLPQHCQMTSKWALLQWRADIVKCPSRWCRKRQSVPRRRLG